MKNQEACNWNKTERIGCDFWRFYHGILLISPGKILLTTDENFGKAFHPKLHTPTQKSIMNVIVIENLIE
jgi:hypothetical protein